MKLGGSNYFRRSVVLAAACVLAVVLTACTGKGGGYLPPQTPAFTGQASFGFTFSCAKGDLKTELSYTDKGSNPIGSSFGIHGIVDTVDPVLKSAVCIGENPPPGRNELIFLGRYRLTTSPPAGFPNQCPTRETPTTPMCRFEVIVRDNDRNLAPSPGDYFSIKLSTNTTPCTDLNDFTCTQFPGFYTRDGLLAGGNITVK
jgi:hypothetical protein